MNVSSLNGLPEQAARLDNRVATSWMMGKAVRKDLMEV